MKHSQVTMEYHIWLVKPWVSTLTDPFNFMFVAHLICPDNCSFVNINLYMMIHYERNNITWCEKSQEGNLTCLVFRRNCKGYQFLEQNEHLLILTYN